DLFVLGGNDGRQRLQQDHFGATGVVEGGELHADGSGAADEDRLRLRRQRHRLFVGEDLLAVVLQKRQRLGPRGGGQHDVLGFRRFPVDGEPALRQLRGAANQFDFVFLEEKL